MEDFTRVINIYLITLLLTHALAFLVGLAIGNVKGKPVVEDRAKKHAQYMRSQTKRRRAGGLCVLCRKQITRSHTVKGKLRKFYYCLGCRIKRADHYKHKKASN